MENIHVMLDKNCITFCVEYSLAYLSPLDSMEIKLANPKGNQPWIFIGRTEAEVEATILWPLEMKSWHIGKDPEAGKGWGQEEKGATEDEMVASIVNSMDMNLSKLQETVKHRKAWHAAVHGVVKCCTPVSDWTTTITKPIFAHISFRRNQRSIIIMNERHILMLFLHITKSLSRKIMLICNLISTYLWVPSHLHVFISQWRY